MKTSPMMLSLGDGRITSSEQKHVATCGHGYRFAARAAEVQGGCFGACYAPGLDRVRFSGDRFPNFNSRAITLSSQAVSRLSGSLSACDRAEPRAEHPGVDLDCVVDIDPHMSNDRYREASFVYEIFATMSSRVTRPG